MWLEIAAVIVALVFLVYLLFKRKYQYWNSKGVYQIKPSFPVGSIPEFFTKSRAFNDVLIDHAKETQGLPYYGIYFLSSTVLMIKDPDLIRQITIKDFDHFVDRNGVRTHKKMFGNTMTDIIWSKQMSNAVGEEWKNIRSTFTPIFTAGSMKAMMVFIQESCRQLIKTMVLMNFP